MKKEPCSVFQPIHRFTSGAAMAKSIDCSRPYICIQSDRCELVADTCMGSQQSLPGYLSTEVYVPELSLTYQHGLTAGGEPYLRP